jgi:hypothetical protein
MKTISNTKNTNNQEDKQKILELSKSVRTDRI